MTKHLTVRMAWHDHQWDGTICRDPLLNNYCVASRSLLSDRLARDRNVKLEADNPGERLDKLMPEYLPPCYWSSSAFAEHSTQIVHAHPFRQFRNSHRLEESLPGNSVYTWPFRLSLTHGIEAVRRDGKYFRDLEKRVQAYIHALTPSQSLVFFYLNFDNPVSADDNNKYVLVGCARLAELNWSGEFDIPDEEFERVKSGPGMQNFSKRNWAIRVSYDFGKSGVRVPYHEYLRHIEKNPDEEEKFDEIKVLIEEPTLRTGFKYVSEQVNDDCCLYLLYKLRRAFAHVERHGIADPGDAVGRIETYIEEFWRRRGLYPGLASVTALLAQLRRGDPNWEDADDHGLVATVREEIKDDEGLLNRVFQLLTDQTKPGYLENPQLRVLRNAREGLAARPHLRGALEKLSLFDLTPRQLSRVLFPEAAVERGEPASFRGRLVTADDLARNPYLLCEEYVPATDIERETSADLDRTWQTDGVIDYFTIDIGLFPDDDRFDLWDDERQDLNSAGPERLRAFAIDCIRRQEQFGHTYVSLETLVEEVCQHPLFYCQQMVVDRKQVLAEETLAHFRERLVDVEYDGKHFFYLKETKLAEAHIQKFVLGLLDRGDHKTDLSWVTGYLADEANEMAKTIPAFDTVGFCRERTELLEGAFSRALFLVTGRPGSGKTRALREVMRQLVEKGQQVTVLAPTGKATLRVREEAKDANVDANVQTIDLWLSQCGLRKYLDDPSQLSAMSPSKYYKSVDNLIIDEMSMVDLAKLAVVFRALEIHESSVRRVILVGDENQLPPIGIGRPFHDILAHLQEDEKLRKRHVVRLRTNCRQKQDHTVLDAAELFAGKNRYRTELYDRLLKGGEISKHLRVEYWDSPQDLLDKLVGRLNAVLKLPAMAGPDDCEVKLNTHFNLYENGFVKDMRENELLVDAWQLLSPYRGGSGGTFALNGAVRQRYKAKCYPPGKHRSAFSHSEKLIRTANFYQYNPKSKQRELRLSNGSIGVLCDNAKGRLAWFPEIGGAMKWEKMDEEDFDPAYAITVHKAQGSEFGDVFVVVPERRALLSRELLYTAMTRSTGPLTLFVQQSPRENPLDIARSRSDLLRRNSSLFCDPVEARRVYQPEGNVRVKSKIEFIIYDALRSARVANRLLFDYELIRELPFGGRRSPVRPDFRVIVGGRTYYWEHLGMLDREDYYHDWKERRAAYVDEGLADVLVTTDDSQGIRRERIETVIEHIIANTLESTPDSPYSLHHYQL